MIKILVSLIIFHQKSVPRSLGSVLTYIFTRREKGLWDVISNMHGKRRRKKPEIFPLFSSHIFHILVYLTIFFLTVSSILFSKILLEKRLFCSFSTNSYESLLFSSFSLSFSDSHNNSKDSNENVKEEKGI